MTQEEHDTKDDDGVVPQKRIGRPKKSAIEAKSKRGGRGKVGRPKGEKAIIDEYKARMLNSPKSPKVLETILNAALNDDHKHQAAAWKLVVDRIMPVAAFEKDVVKGAGRNAIQINITGVNGNTTEVTDIQQDDIIDGDYTEE